MVPADCVVPGLLAASPHAPEAAAHKRKGSDSMRKANCQTEGSRDLKIVV